MAYLDNSSKHFLKNVHLPVKEEILKDIKHRNAMETLQKDGWPRTFYNNKELCPICESPLSAEAKKRQKTAENETILLTRDHCIPVIALSKKCKTCLLILPPVSLDLGVLNIGDTLLLSLELIYSMQHLVRLVLIRMNAMNNAFSPVK